MEPVADPVNPHATAPEPVEAQAAELAPSASLVQPVEDLVITVSDEDEAEITLPRRRASASVSGVPESDTGAQGRSRLSSAQ